MPMLLSPCQQPTLAKWWNKFIHKSDHEDWEREEILDTVMLALRKGLNLKNLPPQNVVGVSLLKVSFY